MNYMYILWEDVVEEVLHGVDPPQVAMEMDDPARNHTHHDRYLIHAAAGGDSVMMVGMDTAKPHPQRCHLLQNSHVKQNVHPPAYTVDLEIFV